MAHDLQHYIQRRNQVYASGRGWRAKLQVVISEALTDSIHVHVVCAGPDEGAAATRYLRSFFADPKSSFKHVGYYLDKIPDDHLRIDWRYLDVNGINRLDPALER